MLSDKKVYSFNWAGKPLRIEIGELAKQANGAALVSYGETVVLSTVTASKEPKEGSFFPLTVNYDERAYAVGKIPGGFIKREGRPSDQATLSARLIDRPIRPLFPEGFRNEVVIGNMVLSLDLDSSAQMAAMLGSSLALSLSDIPFFGPIAGVMIGRVDGQFVVNPTVDQQKKSDLHLTVAGTKEAINMVEAGADQIPEETMLDAILFAHEQIKEVIAFEEQIISENKKKKMEVTLFRASKAFEDQIRAMAADPLNQAMRVEEKQARDAAIKQVNERVLSKLEQENNGDQPMDRMLIDDCLHTVLKEEVRRMIVEEHLRPDGRAVDEIRPLSARVGILPRAHGSGLFTRGQTQALSVCTLAPLSEAQTLDDFDAEESKRFLHHYNFPGFSTGEAKATRSPGRREIGHGALGERALAPVIPGEQEFPYMIRCVSEVLESNGSSSQASICGSTLALMDAGVPIKAPVAGIAMGLVKHGDKVVVLTDIQGMEDSLGDMDFKCAGTEKGVTALQMDIKISGVTREILSQALRQARAGRMRIMETLLATLEAPRDHLARYAPKIIQMQINPNKIRDVIGSSGKVINKIIEQTGVKIDIEQDGSIKIFSIDEANARKAKQIIEDLVRVAHVGEIFVGKVKRIEKFGAFVSLFGHTDGLIHVSELDTKRVTHVEDVVSIGDEVRVKVIEVDQHGRIKLSRKALLTPSVVTANKE
ncbi:polyribonucleotide nucleotidyltransferase [Sporolactobacillus inulinus]|uniref:Polyribonucleotide nucleotidyltransferase n=1 Tax=Sporolactobacillus inulinus CASD TaxID=1069536 RepID=A0A0U1QQL5_9BACL|nr:polyribonucleotide nucleotidyltransferase [Sporolactobacillus inulinus]KLI03111.1 polynucleotide phosphorylase [Sporolactobacillus inulinus CASD]GEB75944.1 polyribonucleotide nucleotidyltransferase [Sporolactobacillus inulinus]